MRKGMQRAPTQNSCILAAMHPCAHVTMHLLQDDDIPGDVRFKTYEVLRAEVSSSIWLSLYASRP